LVAIREETKSHIKSCFLNYSFLLTYYCYLCTGGMLWLLQKWLQYILGKFTPSIIPFILFPPFSEWFQQVSCFHFHTWVHNIFFFYYCLLLFFLLLGLSTYLDFCKVCVSVCLTIFIFLPSNLFHVQEKI
jgi:hypothetical protein